LSVGFGSAATFCTAFRRVTGTTPSAYRRLAGAEWRSDVPFLRADGLDPSSA